MKVDWINRVCKWRTVFAGWQLGSRPKGDPESDAVRDHRELSILMRCEISAIIAMLVEKGIVTAEELGERTNVEAEILSKVYEKAFPGFKAEEFGLSIDPKVAAETTKGWKP
jgi:hypothetical protein